ncbi:MAG: 3'-5' exonuclease [Salinivirgaceae bacterium]|jgi:DNA polymerase elongation subunit (family B)|nr:3'-5' exonuclease [Salinivirgaceae bacterium]
MLEKIKIENILFLDIETVSQTHDFSELNERSKELWAKKMQWRIEKDHKSAEELYEKSAIWSEFGKIVCISAGYIINKGGESTLRVKSFYGHNEKHLLENFAFLLSTHFNKDKHFLCAHNGKEFDFPYIARRMLINELKLPKSLNITGKKPWEVKHIDTMELWKFGDHKHYTSLDLLTAIFNIPSPKTQIDGSMVNKIYWEQGDIPKIADYCQKDVIALCKLLLKFKGDILTDKMHIEITKPSLNN